MMLMLLLSAECVSVFFFVTHTRRAHCVVLCCVIPCRMPSCNSQMQPNFTLKRSFKMYYYCVHNGTDWYTCLCACDSEPISMLCAQVCCVLDCTTSTKLEIKCLNSVVKSLRLTTMAIVCTRYTMHCTQYTIYTPIAYTYPFIKSANTSVKCGSGFWNCEILFGALCSVHVFNFHIRTNNAPTACAMMLMF